MPDPLQALQKASSIGDDPFGPSKLVEGSMPLGPGEVASIANLLKNRGPLFKEIMERLSSGTDLSSIPRSIRQAAMGMEDTVYHGTRNKAASFGMPPDEEVEAVKEIPFLSPNRGLDSDFGIHVDHDPAVAASAISRGAGGEKYYSRGARIIPLKARIQDPLDLPDMAIWRDPHMFTQRGPKTDYKIGKVQGIVPGLEKWKNVADPSMPPSDVVQELRQAALRLSASNPGVRGSMKAQEEWPELFTQILKKHGHDSVRYINNIEGIGNPSHLLLDSNQVRVPWANFDPRKFRAGDLLAGLAGAGIATPMLMKSHGDPNGTGSN